MEGRSSRRSWARISAAIALGLGLASNAVWAQDGLAPAGGDAEIGGLILDRTLSPFGKGFYRAFFDRWSEEGAQSGRNVVVGESVLPQSATLVWVDIDGNRVYRQVLGRKKEDGEAAAEQAAHTVLAYLASEARGAAAPELAADGY